MTNLPYYILMVFVADEFISQMVTLIGTFRTYPPTINIMSLPTKVCCSIGWEGSAWDPSALRNTDLNSSSREALKPTCIEQCGDMFGMHAEKQITSVQKILVYILYIYDYMCTYTHNNKHIICYVSVYIYLHELLWWYIKWSGQPTNPPKKKTLQFPQPLKNSSRPGALMWHFPLGSPMLELLPNQRLLATEVVPFWRRIERIDGWHEKYPKHPQQIHGLFRLDEWTKPLLTGNGWKSPNIH